jgi:HSP20 family protein
MTMFRDLIPWSRGGSRLAVRREPEDLFSELHREMNQLFDDVWRGFGNFEAPAAFGNGGLRRMQPRIDVAETDKDIEVTAELPGLDDKDVEVTLADGILTIKGEKKDERKEEGKGFYLAERSYGAFQRSIRLPQGVDADKVSADFTKGVLRVTAPKLPEVQSNVKKIAVKAT